MNWRTWIVLVGVVLGSTAAPPAVSGDEPDGGYGGRQQFVPWKIGVDGINTSVGFVISNVFRGYPAGPRGSPWWSRHLLQQPRFGPKPIERLPAEAARFTSRALAGRPRSVWP